MGEHRSVNDFLPKAEAKQTELKDETNAISGIDTTGGDTGKDIAEQSGGSNTGSSNEGIGAGVGADGKQTDTSNNVGGLGDGKADASSKNPTDGVGSATSTKRTQKSTKSNAK